jgi:hypothetical protein
MAFVRVRHASMYVAGKKVAEMFSNTYHVGSGDEPQFGDDGFQGMSDGAITTTLDCETIVPVIGTSVDILSLLLNKQDSDINLGLMSGRLHTVTMRCTEADYKSDAKTGTLTGTFKFFGGVPTLT